MGPRALLFDFDGVIADTENIHIVAWERTFGTMGWSVPTETCERAAEADDRTFLAEVFAARGIIDADLDGWLRRKQRLTVELLEPAPPIYPGAVELVRWLRGRTRLAIVTTTWRENVETVLRTARLTDAFELIVAKEDVAQVKPDPSAYRLALKKLALDASEALAIEDSATGLKAAQGAGLHCVIVGHRKPAGDWIGESAYVADLTDPERFAHATGLEGV